MQDRSADAEPIEALTPVHDVDARAAKLGQRLFADTRLSGDGSVSCLSCHSNASGADTRRFSAGAFGRVRAINAPTVLNVRFNTAGLNWNARTPDLEAQVLSSVSNPETMAQDWNVALKLLAADAEIAAQFNAVYGPGDAVTQRNVAHAIASYEKSLVTPSRFDDWLQGRPQALTELERRGYARFKAEGCIGCHAGVNVGGNGFAKLGLTGDYFADRERRGGGGPADADKGRFLVTKRPEDLHVFRVPGLRNVALTAPYFHDGSVATLDEAIALMARFQLGREIEPEGRREIEAFLRSLTGKDLSKAEASR
jgi:cytochrome c peroxidase